MEITIQKNYNLQRLQRWLDYELSSSVMALFSWFWGILLFLMLIAAVVFTPFMLKILFDEKKYGWIIYFFFLVVVPAAAAYFIKIDPMYKFLLAYIPFGLFYFYCFQLKLAVRTWVQESNFINNKDFRELNTDEIFKNSRF